MCLANQAEKRRPSRLVEDPDFHHESDLAQRGDFLHRIASDGDPIGESARLTRADVHVENPAIEHLQS
jgi:hypothetical protein